MSNTKEVLMKMQENPESLTDEERAFCGLPPKGKIKIVCTPIIAKDLEPGDLFSASGQELWDMFLKDERAVGQKVYIRTANDCSETPDANATVYKITILK